MKDGFYKAFEDRFRGSREEIKARLEVYLPFIIPLREAYPDAQAVDLGCGRGEWLELLSENGFKVQGVDIDDGMLLVCRDLGLSVYVQDALDFLRELPDETQTVVSGFHIAEHVSFAVLQEMISEAKRVLVPGGLLILETPNPENLVVGTTDFYLDPTHQRPIPPQLLAFLVDQEEYGRSKVIRLQESKELLDRSAPSLLSVLNGVSPDYCVIAQKAGPEELFEAINKPFEDKYGITLEELANRYQKYVEIGADLQTQRLSHFVQHVQVQFGQLEDLVAQQSQVLLSQLDKSASQAEARATKASAEIESLLESLQQAQTLSKQSDVRASKAEAKSAALQATLEATQKELAEVHCSNHNHWQQLQDARNELNDLRFRIEANLVCPPQVNLNQRFKRLAGLPERLTRRLIDRGRLTVRRIAVLAMRFVRRWPRLRDRLLDILDSYPGFKSKLRKLAATEGLEGSSASGMHNTPAGFTQGGDDGGASGDEDPASIQQLSKMTPRARYIYDELKRAIKEREKEVG